MTTTAQRAGTTQVYQVHIRTTAQAIWDAITQPEWTARYGYTGLVEYDLRPGGRYLVRPTPEFRAAGEAQGRPVPDVLIEGEVLEVDPPHRLVTTFRMLMDPQLAGEPVTRITHEIVPVADGCTLTVTHQLDGAPGLAALVGGQLADQGAGGGHAWILAELKALLES